MSDLLVEGLTKRSPVGEMPVTFDATGASDSVGIPFIRNAKDDGRITISARDSDGQLFSYIIDSYTGTKYGKGKLNDEKYRKSIFTDDPTKYSCGPWGKTGYIYAQNLNNYAIDGVSLVYAKKRDNGNVDTVSAASDFPEGHKVLGVVINGKHSYAMVITAPTDDDPTDGFSYTDCQYHIFDGKGNLSEQGTVDGSVSINTFGFGRSPVWGNIACVLEVNEKFVWTVSGEDPYTVSLWSYDTGVLTLSDSADSGFGISDSAYSTVKPAVIVRSGRLIVVAGEIVYRYKRVTVGNDFGYDGSKTWIMEIIKTECTLSGELNASSFILTDAVQSSEAGDITFDSTLDWKSLQGFMTTGGAIRDNIDALRAIGFFDPMVRGYGFRFRCRNSDSVATIPWGHFGASSGSGDNVEGVTYSLKNETKIPKIIEFTYQDLFRLYDQNTVRVESETLSAQGKESLTFAGVLTNYDAKHIAEIIKIMRYTEKTGYASTLPQTYGYLEVGDVVTLQLEFESGYIEVLVRILTLNNRMDGTIAFTSISIGAATYASYTPETLPPPDEEEPPMGENAVTLYLNVPCMNVAMQNNDAILIAAAPTSETWGGNSILLSTDDEQTFSRLLEVTSATALGSISTTSPLKDCALVDRGTNPVVTLVSGELVSITEVELFTNKNIAAWGNDTDGWEIFQFQTATLNMDGTYTLSNLLRGLYGTEYLTAHSADDTFVMIDGNNEIALLPENLIDVPTVMMSLNIGETIDDGDTADFTYSAMNLKPWSGVKATASRASHTITLNWVRRSRYSNSWRSSVEVPLNENSESYEIDVMDGSTVVRTITTSTPTAVYTGAQQMTDFGSYQNPCSFKIYQMSASVGRGVPYEVTV